jgi:hypothetical protein
MIHSIADFDEDAGRQQRGERDAHAVDFRRLDPIPIASSGART